MEWIPIIISVIGPLLAFYVAYRVNTAVNQERWADMNKQVAKFDRWHSDHFDHAKKAESDMARAQQQIEDHDKRDNEWFLRIESMLREIRDNLRHKMKLDPDELRQIGAELDTVIIGHPQVLQAEPEIRKHIEDARDNAMKKYKDIREG